MRAIFFAVKNYLYAKNKLKFIATVLVALLLTSCITNVVRKGAAGETEKPIPYDLPANAPIPPVKYCFEKPGVSGAGIELIIAGDSVYGNADFAKPAKLPSGDFKGVIYGTTLILSYRFKSDTGFVTQDEQWQVTKDSLFLLNPVETTDSAVAVIDSSQLAGYAMALHKITCK